MNQKVISGLTATLLMTTLGMPLAGNAEQPKSVNQGAETDRNQASPQPAQPEQNQVGTAVNVGKQDAPDDNHPGKLTAFNQPSTPELKLTHAVVKLGEQQSPASNAATPDHDAIAKVHAYELAGRKAATLYVRNIPILTFTGSGRAAAETVKMGSRQLAGAITVNKSLSSTDTTEASASGTAPKSSESASTSPDAAVAQGDPVLRDAKSITVSWDKPATKSNASDERYAIKANKTLIAIIDRNTMLANTTRSLESDALQATNRLRRLLGNASPLNGVSGKPSGWSQPVAVGPIRLSLSGLASWYGPGFHGSPSASGETFNENAMTAAHRTLPFGTQVLVTNLNNGQSVVVRINDRGPYSGDRVIDLSTAAARVLGLIQSGVAPVRLDVLDNTARTATASGN